MKANSILAAVLLAIVPVASYAADSAADQLRRFIRTVPAAQGQFTQQTESAQGQMQAKQEGNFAFLRPGKFRWNVTQPFEQQIVSDGRVLYQYDPDLEQVTERDVDDSIGASPAAILFGTASLEDSFELTEQGQRDGLSWLRAKPRSADAGFAYVDMGFADGKPQSLELKDAFDQITYIRFSGLEINPALPAHTFSFTLPDGVDLVKLN